MSDYPPSVSIEEQLGADYEKYVAGYFEQVFNCTVIPQGRILGVRDGGVDLIAVNDETAFLVQCKYYRAESVIHSKYVSQLYGDACVFAARFPEARSVTPVLVAHCGFASDAKDFAATLNVKLIRLPYQPVALPYMTGKNYLSSLMGDYDSAVREVLISHLPALSGRHSAPEPTQKPALPDQTALPAYQPAPEPAQTIPAADQTIPAPNHPTSPAASSTPPYKPDPDAPVFRDPEKTFQPSGTKTPVPDEFKSEPVSGKYYVIPETPLKYHYISRNFLAPLGILGAIGTFADPAYQYGTLYFIVDMIQIIAALLFVLGSSRFTKSCYRSLFVWRLFVPVVASVMIVFNLSFGFTENAMAILPDLFAGFIWGVPSVIYYRKRKALFFPELIPENVQRQYDMAPGSDRTPPPSIWAVFLVIIAILACILVYTGDRFSEHPTIDTSRMTATLNPKATASNVPSATIEITGTPKHTATPEPIETKASTWRPNHGGYHGYIASSDVQYTERVSSLTVTTPDNGLQYCLVFVGKDNPSQRVFATYFLPGYTKSVDVPAISALKLYIARGKSWLDWEDFFGDETEWFVSDSIYDFKEYTYELSFKKVNNGNWSPDAINAAEVPFLN